MPSHLSQLRKMSVIVADTGDLQAVHALKPVDCTTNPSLILKAVREDSQAPFVTDALAWGRQTGASVEDVIHRLVVNLGTALANIVTGRVSIEVDADLSFDTERMVAQARALIARFEAHHVPRTRILIKLASTWEGVQAARILQREGIDCNMTLIFSLVQAVACAQAGAFLVSPFVGRILDWHLKAGEGPFTAETDPGVRSVKDIYAYYKMHKIKTHVMAASFRNLGEIEALAGCDRLTIAPAFLTALDAQQGDLPRNLSSDMTLTPEALAQAPNWEKPLHEAEFRWRLNENAMASEKLAEGIRLFARDLTQLRNVLAPQLR